MVAVVTGADCLVCFNEDRVFLDLTPGTGEREGRLVHSAVHVYPLVYPYLLCWAQAGEHLLADWSRDGRTDFYIQNKYATYVHTCTA